MGENSMPIQAYLNFNGNCQEAVAFYAKVFGIEKPQMMLFSQLPPMGGDPLPEDIKNRVMHTQIQVFDSTLMFSDVLPHMSFVVGNNVNLSIHTSNLEALQAAFEGLKSDGKVLMELQETFWSPCYGQVVDKYGIVWQLNLERN